jgi:hypothetical protein
MHLAKGNVLAELMYRLLLLVLRHSIFYFKQDAVVVFDYLLKFILKLMVDEILQELPNFLDKYLKRSLSF